MKPFHCAPCALLVGVALALTTACGDADTPLFGRSAGYGPNGEPVIQEIKRVSKPGCRVYKKSKDIPVILQGLGISVLSTSQGMLSNREAKSKGVGGEVLCSVQ